MLTTDSVYGSGLRGALALCAAALAAGCSVPTQSVQLGPGSAADARSPARVSVSPAVIQSGSTALVRVEDSTADSLAVESLNGIDRYAVRGSILVMRVGSDFGDTASAVRYATRDRGHLFDILKRPIKITSCRQRRCREYYHELAIKLPERNERSVAVTGGWATAFTRRAITGENRSVLLRQALNNSVWTLQTEVATHGLNVRLQGYYNTDEQGAALDLSQTLKPTNGEMAYGVAMRLAARHADWPPSGAQTGIQGRSVYQISVGPSVMLKGLTASSQIGVYTDGHETLQVLSTVVSFNGNLTEVRSPFSATVEKTFAFGGGPIVSRRRDGSEHLTMGVQVAPNIALRLGMHTRRSSWPVAGSTGDIQAFEMYYSLGMQYTLSW